MNELSVENLHILFRYDPITGDLVWKVSNSPTGRAGSIAGSIKPSGYRIVCIDGRYYRCHRIAYAMIHGRWPNGEVDHINRNRSDNRADNLRDCTRIENSVNRGMHTNNKSGFKGVSFDQNREMWMASIKVSGRTIFLGRYTSPEEASAAYQKAHLSLRGSPNRANDPARSAPRQPRR